MKKPKKIRLFWYKKRNVRHGNFGDELGPYLISRLSGSKVEYVPIPRDGLLLLATYIKNLMLGRYDLGMLPSVFMSFFMPGRYLVSVGSIIGWSSGWRTVWGSGILYYDEKVADGEFLAVRGQYTQRRLRNLGLQVPDVLGDPALLLPLIYQPKVEKKFKIGVIPHHTQTEAFASTLTENGDVLLIDLLDDIETVIDKMCSCERIVSTSLHGVIVAHAYGVPALWHAYSSIKWVGSDVKFFDYFSSVDIEEYTPFLISPDSVCVEQLIKRFDAHHSISLIRADLSLIQKKLLDVAPFKIRMYDLNIGSY